jgi:hypothetical protein
MLQNPADRPHRQAVGLARQRRQRVIGAEDIGRAVDQMKVVALAECQGAGMAEDGVNSFMTGPDEQGRFGIFGGRFVIGNADAADP